MVEIAKSELRRAFRERRSALGKKTRSSASSEIVRKIIQLSSYEKANRIAAYWPLSEEVDVRELVDNALNIGKLVFLPRVNENLKKLDLCPFDGDSTDLSPGPFNLKEPKTAPIDPHNLDLLIVPGLAFDLYCHRLGYGVGYYDGLLSMTRAVSIGIAFDMQTIDILPIAEHDIALDKVVTEKRTIEPPGQR